MTITFSINYNTFVGQTLYICGSIAELGGGDIKKAKPMSYTNDGRWEKQLKTVSKQERVISYKYFVKDERKSIIYEVGEPRRIAANNNSKNIFFNDEWQGNTPIAPFLSAPFSCVFYPHGDITPTRTHRHSKEIIIRVTAPNVEKNASILICGNCEALGNWDRAKAINMEPAFGSKWEINLPANNLENTIEYKFIKQYGNGTYIWESCNNRVLNIPKLMVHETYSIEHSAAAFPLTNPRFAGTAIPVFSLRSEKGYGIGDFSDIRLLVDWAEATKQSIIQILPINDTISSNTWTDSYPYAGISIMALHPIYLNLRQMGEFKDKADTLEFEKERKVLNALPQIDYEKVLDHKLRYSKKLYNEKSEETFSEPAYYTFYKNNKNWLLPYAAFCTLRDKYGTAEFSKWEKQSVYNPKIIEKMEKNATESKTMKFYIYLQYHLHLQLSMASNYAHSKGIAIKGDIPIGVTPNSVEAWSEPYYFNMEAQAGAPPDDFSIKGQNWGFPTYNWDIMSKEGYLWWKKRFSKMSEYFDAYRIDHILGFFRIWEIPSNQVLGLMGHFNPALPYCYEDLLSFGFNFNFERHAKPFIRYYQIKEMFKDMCKYIQDTFLNSNEPDVFTLKNEFDTQKKIELYFEKADEPDSPLKNDLMALVGEVLFLEDPNIHGRFHPRISAQFTYSYSELSSDQKESFNRLYDEFFYHRHNDFWKEQATLKLPELISATNMLTCAEDLGMIPSCVPEVLNRLRILTLEIQRMPKDPSCSFGDPSSYPYLCVCTTGTHDTSTLRGWWEENPSMTEKYYREIIKGEGEVPPYCEPWISEQIVETHLNSPALLTILPLQDWLSIDESMRTGKPSEERINVPSNPKHYWRFRMHITLEELIKKQKFNKHVAKIVINSGRNI